MLGSWRKLVTHFYSFCVNPKLSSMFLILSNYSITYLSTHVQICNLYLFTYLSKSGRELDPQFDSFFVESCCTIACCGFTYLGTYLDKPELVHWTALAIFFFSLLVAWHWPLAADSSREVGHTTAATTAALASLVGLAALPKEARTNFLHVSWIMRANMTWNWYSRPPPFWVTD